MTFEVPPDAARVADGEAYCFECSTHAKCASCGAPVMIGPERYADLGGDPIYCVNCQGGSWFGALSWGARLTFAVALAVSLGLGAGAVWSSVSGGEPGELAAGSFLFVVIAGVLYYAGRRKAA